VTQPGRGEATRPGLEDVAPGRAADLPAPLVLRPRKVLIAAWVGAVAVVVLFAVVAVLLRTTQTGR